MFDFAILSTVRSGSHMLATALNGHSEISCCGEYGEESLYGLQEFEQLRRGQVNGVLIKSSVCTGITLPKKLIILRRNFNDCRASKVSPNLHYANPQSISNNENRLHIEPLALEEAWGKMIKHLETADVDKFFISYEEITRNEDCREIPQSKEICEFLDVRYEPLRPTIYKPKVINA